jgi:hypothetical protein
VDASRIGPAVLDGFAHVVEERLRYGLPSGASLACDAAHGLAQ